LDDVPTLTAIPAIIDIKIHWSMCIQHNRVVYTEVSGIGKETASTCWGNMSIGQRYLDDKHTV
jgi:hypothetical protein